MYESIKAKAAAGKIPKGFEIVREMAVDHPTNKSKGGALCRNIRTGIYVLIHAGSASSVPQDWARKMADKSSA